MSTIVSVDLDDVACYHHIHGLEAAAPETASIMLEKCLPRFLEVFEETQTRATFFVLGRDLKRDREGAGIGSGHLKKAAAAGHELGNHSFAHAYDMVTWSAVDMARDVQQCHAELARLGVQARGFRAPGYTHDERLLQQVGAAGYLYDSSRMPSLPYWFAKKGMMGWMRAKGRTSGSYDGGMRSFLGRDHARFLPRVGLWEVPVSVHALLRTPFVGTFFLSGPRSVRVPLVAEALRRRHLHLELHAIDLADEKNDGFDPALVALQPELKVPLKERRQRLTDVLKARGGGQSILSAVSRAER